MVREAKTQWLSMPEHFMTDYRSIASYIRSDIYLELCKCRDFLQSRYVVQSNTNPLVTDHETVCPTSSAGTLCIDSPRRLARDVIAQALGIITTDDRKTRDRMPRSLRKSRANKDRSAFYLDVLHEIAMIRVEGMLAVMQDPRQARQKAMEVDATPPASLFFPNSGLDDLSFYQPSVPEQVDPTLACEDPQDEGHSHTEFVHLHWQAVPISDSTSDSVMLPSGSTTQRAAIADWFTQDPA
ncbi:hypothetical protein NLI96_g7752 [Meripilus lineatus]|uniref:Uncharacterized protein n=1 Tax=Meripilus lineatus TaxID=2056292 RepID=A0AAD5V0R5_9APHY|nr:hypothetical protein NLI96_g7752 [Physisporinus lineatus]